MYLQRDSRDRDGSVGKGLMSVKFVGSLKAWKQTETLADCWLRDRHVL